MGSIIQLPPNPYDTSTIDLIAFVTLSLFDNDPMNIEYLAQYQAKSGGVFFYQTQVIREDGTVIFSEQHASFSAPLNTTFSSIYNTEEGTKLKLYYDNSGVLSTKVFSLPGEIPTSTSTDHTISFNVPLIYPNPNNGSFSVKLNIAEGEIGKMDIYSTNGRFIKSYKIVEKTNHFCDYNLFEGMYLVNIRCGDKSSTFKMIINN